MLARVERYRVIPAAAMSLIGNTTCVIFGGSIFAARLIAEGGGEVFKSLPRAVFLEREGGTAWVIRKCPPPLT